MGKLAQTIQDRQKKVALILPDSIPELDSMHQCFYGCEYLVSLENIPSGVTSIRECFKGCENLTKAPVIPSNVTNMNKCFQGCAKLKGVKINRGYADSFAIQAFTGCTSLEDGGIKVPLSSLNDYKYHAITMGTTADKFAKFN